MSTAKNAGAVWLEASDRELLRLVKRGETLTFIANEMGRTPGAIVARMETLAYLYEKFVRAKDILQRINL